MALTVRKSGDWLHVYDTGGILIGSSIAGFGPHTAAAVDVAAALLQAVSEGMHEPDEEEFAETAAAKYVRLMEGRTI